jgi:hypothetical protein
LQTRIKTIPNFANIFALLVLIKIRKGEEGFIKPYEQNKIEFYSK